MYPNVFFGDCRAPWINDITLGWGVVPLLMEMEQDLTYFKKF